ncbi:MAG: GDP-L-fucose synthase [Alphaproteobacteria bacterium]|nr:GDP-L-fucose synthase [Alphaproteobacteria bacterium]
MQNKKIFVAGHRGLVGAALLRRLAREDCQLMTVPRNNLDLRRQDVVAQWFAANKPDIVILAAARVGGIGANAAFPADFIADNLAIQSNVIQAAHDYDVQKLLFLGSSCIYPRDVAQPIQEDALLSGPLEPTNEPYALAKIAGLKMCQAFRRQYQRDFISAMPCNLYGPGDRYDVAGSHVIPALLLKMHQAAQQRAPHVDLWGTGTPLREFMYVDDLADALIFLLQHYSDGMPVNVGSGDEISIADLAKQIAQVTGYKGAIHFDPAMPDGTPRKVLDCTRLRSVGWNPPLTPLSAGLAQSYDDFQARMRDAA